jgi:hypothetical protein
MNFMALAAQPKFLDDKAMAETNPFAQYHVDIAPPISGEDNPFLQHHGDAGDTKKPLTWWETGRDVFNSIKPGLLSGFSDAASASGKAAAIEMGQNPEGIPHAEQTTKLLTSATPGNKEVYEPQSVSGKAVKTGLSFATNPVSYVGGEASIPLKALTALTSGAGSAVAGDLAKGTWMEPYAPFLGAVLGGIAPTKVITPLPVGEQRFRDLQTLKDEGVTGISAGHKTGNRPLITAESQLGNPENLNEAEKSSLFKAAFGKVGEPVGERITGENGTVDTMMKRVGGKFDELGKRNIMQAASQLGNDLVKAESDYNAHVAPSMRAPIVAKVIHDIGSSFPGNGGQLPGDVYQSLRSSIRKEAMKSGDKEKSDALHGIANALDDAMERSIQKTNPNDAGEWAKARRDYRNALILQDWAGGGEQTMTPRTLANSAKKMAGRENYTRGRTDFDDLAEAGSRVLKSFPDSGTGSRQSIEKALSNAGGYLAHALSAGGGYMAGSHYMGGTEGGVGGLLLGEAIGPYALRGVGRGAVMNPVSQAYLGNQLLPKGTTDTMPVWLARALMQTQSNQ